MTAKRSLLLLLSLLAIAGLAGAAGVPAAQGMPVPDTPPSPAAMERAITGIPGLPLLDQREPGLSQPSEYGVAFISAADAPASGARYQQGIATGADWNRWPLYWYNVETSPGEFNWNYADVWLGDRLATNLADDVIAADLAHGFRTEVILMGTPGFYASGGQVNTAPPQVGHRPAGWRDPSKSVLTPQSPATTLPTGLYTPVFGDGTDRPGLEKTINENNKWARFVFRAVERYSPAGITHWEIWNEQDYTFFWSGTATEYARLLKVAYLAAKHADPDAQVIFGGLANLERLNFLADVLAVLAGDSMAPDHDWFFDILATHSYSNSWESWFHVWRANRTLGNYGLEKEIWVNESGSPAWDDYPGPTWDPISSFRSTMEEGAAYVIQSALYARFAGADVIFHFQLYDDCGNDPGGTDFPPNSGEWCNDHDYCAGDAFGLFRNPADGPCYRQHPTPDTARPVFDAYRVLSEHLRGLEPLWRERPDGGSTAWPQEWMAFYRPSTRERVLGLWTRDGAAETAIVAATGTSALLIDQAGTTATLEPVNGTYTLQLGPATNQNTYAGPYNNFAIGGPPLILIETDTLPPEVTASVPSVTGASIPVSWPGEDTGSGIAHYDVWVSVDGGPLTLWLDDTPETGASYAGDPGHTYGFAATGRDQAGNQHGPPTEPQTVAVVGSTSIFLPLVTRGDG